jgi:hypothetical protein
MPGRLVRERKEEMPRRSMLELKETPKRTVLVRKEEEIPKRLVPAPELKKEIAFHTLCKKQHNLDPVRA